MFLHALATAVPPRAYTQAECWDILQRSDAFGRLKERSRWILEKVLRGDNGIDRRHFAAPDNERIFELTPDQLNETFRTEAPKLAADALRRALAQARLRPDDLDALLICTCTGYLCPGLTGYVAETLGLRPDAYLQDLVGLGCGAAIPALRSARNFLAAQPTATVACVAVEICSAAFYLDDDPGVLVSACLFGDGAAATIWRTPSGPDGLHCFDFDTWQVPADRDLLRFEMRGGKLRNLLHQSVPARAAAGVARLYARRSPRPVHGVAAHPGGRDVLAALETALPDHPLATSARVLRAHGNMSSPSVLFALEEQLRAGPPPPGADLWLVSFGAGFSAHSCRIGAA
jgi:predicted naringenin-chalcone synthase